MFDFDFTVDMTRTLLRGNFEAAQWHETMVRILPYWKINTVERVAGFIAQCGHESNNFRNLEENLNYSQQRLLQIFPRYFGAGKRNPAHYAGNPEKIANYVYMDMYRSPRGALGNVQQGDGWMFRGRGLKQLTGRNNYTAFARSVNMSPEQAAEYVGTKPGAIESACWFWDNANCNQFADNKDITGMSIRINGGSIGLADRTIRWNQALRVLGAGKAPVIPNIILRNGSRGPEVRRLQEALGITADGIFGNGTEAALRRWQQANGLMSDGRAGPVTFRRLYG